MGLELVDFPHAGPVQAVRMPDAGQSADSEPVTLTATGNVFMSCQMRLAQPEWVCERDSCRNQNKWAKQHTQKVIDAYWGSKKKKERNVYDLSTQHYTTKMFPHDCNVILYNSSSINNKLKLSGFRFRHNIFTQFRWWKLFQSKPQQNCFVSQSNTAVFRYWMNPSFWTNQVSQWFSNPFIKTVVTWLVSEWISRLNEWRTKALSQMAP